MRWFLIWALSAVPLWAEEMREDHAAVVACFGALDQGADWGQCLQELFEPCAEESVGSEEHLACLLDVRDGWLATIERQQIVVEGKLTDQGATELSDLMQQWFGYVAHKCADLRDDFAATGADVAQTGCEVSEMAALVEELVSCEDGASLAPYCVLQE